MEQGGLRLAVGWSATTRQITSVTIESSRPLAARLLVGCPIAEAAALSLRLFSLCCAAQGAATRLALAAAEGRPVGAVDLELQTVACEAIGEHLWRLLLDWPAFFGLSPDMPTFVHWRKRLQSPKSRKEASALASELRTWLRTVTPPCVDETAAAGRISPLLPWRNAHSWSAVGIDEAFSRAPLLDGLAAETGALARRAEEPAVRDLLLEGRRVAARLAARRADLEHLVDALDEPELLDGWLDATQVGSGIGLARVETARGLLLHLTQVKDGRVARYVIVAPTEWNFHPQGAFSGELVGRTAATREDALMQARRLALSLDPCVSYEVRVEDA